MRPLADRIRERLTQIDVWEDGDGFVLARDVGADVTSYTGSKGWNSSAGHEPPTVEPALRRIRREIEAVYLSDYSCDPDPALAKTIRDAASAFDNGPSLRTLLAYATLIDGLYPLYAEPTEEADGDRSL